MELRHLRYFLTVAEELHFARAAEKLHMDQSPLSRAIKDLEDELGAKLFTRTTRNIRLTHAGKVFLERVPRIFEALEQARDGAKSAASGFHGCENAPNRDPTPKWFTALILFGNRGMQRGHVSRET